MTNIGKDTTAPPMASEILFRYVVESIPQPLILLEPNCHISWLNQATSTLLNYTTEELRGENFSKIVKKGVVREVFTHLNEALKGNEIKNAPISIVAKTGEEKTVEATLSPIKDKSSVTGISIVLNDITETVASRNLLQRLEQEIAERTKKIMDTQRAAVLAIANLAESIDADTGGHLQRMQNYSKILALELQKTPIYKGIISDEYVELIYDLSPLHDLGKVGIDDQILRKPDKLTPEEFEIMKTHTEIGARALRMAGNMVGRESIFSIGEMIAHFHHEKWNGTGYPAVETNGELRPLKGEEIPLCARIVALADVYDALTSKRPYKDPFPHELAKEIIKKDSGKHFEPTIVETFLKVENDFIKIKKQYPENSSDSKPFELPARDVGRQTIIMARDKWLKDKK